MLQPRPAAPLRRRSFARSEPFARHCPRRSTAAIVVMLALSVIAGCSSAASSSGTTASTSSTAGTRPNIVFVLTDDLAFAEMPYLKNAGQLAKDGLSFDNYLISNALCCPSRVTMLRAQYAHNTGVLRNTGADGGFGTAHQLGLEDDTFATALQAGGYRTSYVGKYLNEYPHGEKRTYVPPGWNDFVAPVLNVNQPYDLSLNENGKVVKYGDAPADFHTDVYARHTIDFVDKASKDHQPFIAVFAPFSPHAPAVPAPRHANLFNDLKAPRTPNYDEDDVNGKPSFVSKAPKLTDKRIASMDETFRNRVRSMQSVDEALGQLVDTLRQNGQLDNTYIFFTSDNGFHLGQHRQLTGKQTGYDEDVRVPMIVRGPDVPADRHLGAVTGNTDLAPTLLDLGGVANLAFADGRTWKTQLHAPDDTQGTRTSYLLEHWAPKGSDGEDEAPDLPKEEGGGTNTTQPPGSDALVPDFKGIRTARYSYLEYGDGEHELYDDKADPYQLHNIYDTVDAGLREQLAQRTAGLFGCRTLQCRDLEDRPIG